MSFDLSGNGSYGSGALGDVTDPQNPVINAYAAASEFNTNTFLAVPVLNSDYVAWNIDSVVGHQVMLHCHVAKSGNNSMLGKYLVATITNAETVSGALRITIDRSTAELGSSFDSWYWQAILIPEFKNLTLQSKSVQPLALTFDYSDYPLGGVIVFKCSDTLTLAGGHIDLRDKGFNPTFSTNYRPNFPHENSGTLDTDLYSGSENSIAKDRLIVNCGDGACLVIAKNINSSGGSSRIGNPNTYGVQYCRGASDSTGTPAGVSNVGGSTIAIVASSWTNFTPNIIAKYRSGSTGRGRARAYIAIRNAYNNIKPDEGLYALDLLPDTSRVKNYFNLTGFGNGSDGNYYITSQNASKCWNSYAKVTAVSGRVYTITRVRADKDEVTDFAVGRLVMIHQTRKTSGSDWQDGNFKFSRIVALSGSTVTIKHNFTFDLNTYYVQMIVVPEYNNLTVSKLYNHTPPFQNGAGGIFAIAVKGNCDLSDGSINLGSKGNSAAGVNPIISNYSMKGALPIGLGNGSVLIIAKNLTLNGTTRIGATHDGSPLSGYANYGTARAGETLGSAHGAHILIISDSIDGLALPAISTGGGSAGAGYRDSNGVSGAAFIYCNDCSNQENLGIVLD